MRKRAQQLNEKKGDFIMNTTNLQKVKQMPSHSFHPNASLRMVRRMAYVAGVDNHN